MQPTGEQIEAGQAVYTRRTLAVYDFIVHGISNRFIWKCPTRAIEALYNRHLSANHLDVGVGTGYFLDRCRFPSDTPRVALMDMNLDTLDYASRRIRRYRPECHCQNILEPITADIAPFDSVGVNYLLHCVPGAIADKAVAFDHLKVLMNPGARLFGSTILHDGVPRGWTAKKLMAVYNRNGVFANRADTLAELREALEQRFDDLSVEVVGCVALFAGKLPW